jgi:hypothetical protein
MKTRNVHTELLLHLSASRNVCQRIGCTAGCLVLGDLLLTPRLLQYRTIRQIRESLKRFGMQVSDTEHTVLVCWFAPPEGTMVDGKYRDFSSIEALVQGERISLDDATLWASFDKARAKSV